MNTAQINKSNSGHKIMPAIEIEAIKRTKYLTLLLSISFIIILFSLTIFIIVLLGLEFGGVI